MHYGGWDTHKFQQDEIEPKYADLFGANMSLDTLFQNLTGAFNNTVVSISGEFGRQLRANGANSTDHGNGNTIILLGGSVTGGVYGEMFPASEISRYDSFHEGIDGRTDFYSVYQSLITKMDSSAAHANIFSYAGTPTAESGYGNFASIIT
jgi:uncharacterized protein (DUF1501 family)